MAVLLEYEKLNLDPRDGMSRRELETMQQAMRNISSVMEHFGFQKTFSAGNDTKSAPRDEALHKRDRNNSFSSSEYQHKYEPHMKRPRVDDRASSGIRNSGVTAGRMSLSRASEVEASSMSDVCFDSARVVTSRNKSTQELDLELLREVPEFRWRYISGHLSTLWKERRGCCSPKVSIF